ncbi:MAG TPA: hypothetical protein PKA63_06950 [Oligoflexia bacterium]|nr:hypothetical protein [Oligoflexia bacterium]HMP48388.1 hypothetical protein [Oligoflexia bacterium]
MFSRILTCKEMYTNLCIGCSVRMSDVHKATLMLFGTVLFFAAGSDNAWAGRGSFGVACNKMLALIEGAFGALVAAAAGVAAIVAAALGGFKMAWALVVVSVGSFILRAFITIFSGECGIGVGVGF